MTLFRFVQPSVRNGLIVAIGSVLIAAPIVIGMSFSAAFFGLVVGVLTVALGLAGADEVGRSAISVSTRATYDLGLAIGLLIAALVFGISGQPAALALFGVAGLAAGVVATNTRYTAAY
jgi:hypothetical protein